MDRQTNAPDEDVTRMRNGCIRRLCDRFLGCRASTMTNEAGHAISRNAAAIFKARLTRNFSSSAASEPKRRKKPGLLSKNMGGNKRRAAELGISRAQLYRHLKEQSAE
ncbi:hypothetical protein [Ensifer aridi]|uniref:hypothetical protein n=1 Tax=Ensifer aridi TaxID=1708715 RepID=UPI0015E43548|nr:hypothetical protein [Ensifer aridi]